MAIEFKKIAKRLLKPNAHKPVLGNHPYGGPEDSPITLVMVCREGFNINIPNASATIRLGFCRGFVQIGVRYQLVSVWELEKVLPELHRPFIFLSCYDYEDLDSHALKVLRDYPHLIWVYPWFDNLTKVYTEYNLPDPRLAPQTAKRILESGANCVFAPVPSSCLHFYEEWEKRGQKVVSLPLACDTTRYFSAPDVSRFVGVKMAFVGGYRTYKNIQYDKYLKPYEDILRVYGYDRWPYKDYGGLLADDDERVLYQNAVVCPALSEPHAELMGDIVERAFKVMGSGGLAVTDIIPGYREFFTPDELLVPDCVDEYHAMVRQALTDSDFNRAYRVKGYQAILARHTYAHRARAILECLGLAAVSGVNMGSTNEKTQDLSGN
jgi:hypothetical protein